MALKDEVLKNYFQAPLSRKKITIPEASRKTNFGQKKHRFSHDEDVEESLLETTKSDLNDRSLNSYPIPQSSIQGIIGEDKGFQKIVEKKHLIEGDKKTLQPRNIETNSGNELSILVKKVTGLQKDVLLFIFDRCLSAGVDSGPIDLLDIANKYNKPVDFVRTAIKRLLGKKLIVKRECKRGRAGYSAFYIPTEVKEMMKIYEHHFK